jgi:hypothetical protein
VCKLLRVYAGFCVPKWEFDDGKTGRILVNMKTKPTPSELTALELRRKIAVREAAELNGVSEDTFRRHYGHLIRKISARRDVVELRDAIELPPK